jgi:hypothetical protein
MELEMDVPTRIHAAVSILQAQILAQHTALNPAHSFGTDYMPTPSLEVCERLLVSVLQEIEIAPRN